MPINHNFCQTIFPLSPPQTRDSFMVQVEPYASTTPFMTTVGNHDAVPGNITNSSGTFVDVWGAAFEARLRMPAASSGM